MTDILINPDTKYVEEVKFKIKENKGYCPCKIFKNIDTKCMCKEFREQQNGYCSCGLYFKDISNEN